MKTAYLCLAVTILTVGCLCCGGGNDDMSLAFRAGYEKNASVCGAIKNEEIKAGCFVQMA